ncbi:hypothetical protein T439DRAFT_361109 [Meredithblackwellia eburnea MCA 4105]
MAQLPRTSHLLLRSRRIAAEQNGSLSYHLPRHASENQRLDNQHHLLKEVFNGFILHPSITLPANDASILESGTGTGIWLKDLAASSPVPIGRIVAFDLSDIQFPPSDERRLEVKGGKKVEVEFFTHSVVEALPREMKGSFDLVHQRLLVVGLREGDWAPAVRNLAEAAKPGGWVQIVECQAGITADGKQTRAITNADTVMKIASEVSGKDKDCVDKIGKRMAAAGLTSISELEAFTLYGPSNPNPSLGARLIPWVCNVAHHLWKVSSIIAPERLPVGIRTEEESRLWLEDLTNDLRNYGGRTRWVMGAGRRPE